MNRRALLAAVAAVPLLSMPQAHADVPVLDAASLAQLVNSINWLRAQYQELTQQVRAVTDGLDLGNVSPTLLTQALQNPMGAITNQLPNLIGGATLGNIPGAQQFLQNDRFYQATGGDLRGTTLNNAAIGLANLKALAMQLINTNQQRIGQLNGLQNELTGAQDVAQVARINGRISLENQTLAAQQAQAVQVVQMAQLERQIEDQRMQQRQRLDDEQEMNDTASILAGGTTGQPAAAAPTFVGN